MSRLDYFTVAIVAICLAAIIFLLYRTTDLFKSEVPVDPPTQEEPAEEIIDPADYDPDLAGSQDTDSTAMADAAAEPQETANPAEDEKEEEEPTEEPEEDAFTELYNAGGGVGDFLVLAGSFEYRHNADNQANQLKKLGYQDAEVVLFNRGKYATVLVDRFDSMSDAQALVNRLNGQNVEAYVHAKRTSN